jgi:hypothetical protein
MRMILLGTTLLAIGGCSLTPQADVIRAAVNQAVDTAIQDRKAFNDRKAEVTIEASCDISLGAYYRLDNAVKQKGLRLLCSGKDDGQPEEKL